MQTITHGACTFTLQPTRNMTEFYAKLAKCTGKSKRTPVGKCRRTYPVFTLGMSTREYVRAYESQNGHFVFRPGFYGSEDLNTEPCTLYSGADTHETIDEPELACA